MSKNESILQPSHQDKTLAVNVSVNHRDGHIFTCQSCLWQIKLDILDRKSGYLEQCLWRPKEVF